MTIKVVTDWPFMDWTTYNKVCLGYWSKRFRPAPGFRDIVKLVRATSSTPYVKYVVILIPKGLILICYREEKEKSWCYAT